MSDSVVQQANAAFGANNPDGLRAVGRRRTGGGVGEAAGKTRFAGSPAPPAGGVPRLVWERSG